MINLKESSFANYLFTSKSNGSVFSDIETTFYQLNDYCFFLLEKTKSEFKKNQYDYSPEGQAKAEDEVFENIKDEKISTYEDLAKEMDEDINPSTYQFGPEDIIDFWRENYYFLTPANILVLLYFNTEKSLKNLCIELNTEKNNVVKLRLKPSHNTSKIEEAFKHLNDKCNIQYTPSDNVKLHLKEINKIRNNFAHGDWDLLKERLSKIDLIKSFKIASSIFEDIEKSFMMNK